MREAELIIEGLQKINEAYDSKLWYKARIIDSSMRKLRRVPDGAIIYVKKHINDTWLVFRGDSSKGSWWDILSVSEAKAKLETLRDDKGNPIPADNSNEIQANYNTLVYS